MAGPRFLESKIRAPTRDAHQYGYISSLAQEATSQPLQEAGESVYGYTFEESGD